LAHIFEPVSDFGMEEAERWLADWTASVSQTAEQAKRLSDRVAALSASAQNDDGVRVAVDATGQITELILTERSLRLSPTQLASGILDTMRKAQRKLPQLVAEAAGETVGADSSSASAVVSAFERRFPAPEPDDDRYRRG
jgi:sugar (pentulose or hexulose) kinase